MLDTSKSLKFQMIDIYIKYIRNCFLNKKILEDNIIIFRSTQDNFRTYFLKFISKIYQNNLLLYIFNNLVEIYTIPQINTINQRLPSI